VFQVLACRGAELLPEFEEKLGTVAAETEMPDRIVRVVEQRG